jgi:predicted acetyltransferase
MDYRPVPEAHREAFRRRVSYAFQPESGPDRGPDEDEGEEAFDHPDSYHRRGLYDVDPGAPATPEDLAVVCAYYGFEARIRDAFHPVGGVAAVASPPEWRRRGLIGQLLDGLHREFRDEGTPVAALWPFKHGFYRQFGYARISQGATAVVPAAALEAVAAAPAGRFRRLDADDWAVADAVHREWATETFGLRRSEGFWRHRVFEGWDEDPYVYAWFDGDGRPRGYLVYQFQRRYDDRFDGEENPRRLAVSELAFADDEARAQLYRFLYDHDSQVADVSLRGPVGTRLFDELDDPRDAEVELWPGHMARAVDVPAAVEAFDYPAGAAGTLVLDVADDRCPWNDATFAVEVADGAATCRETDADPAVRVGIGTLTQVLVGSHSVAEAERDGDLRVETTAARETLRAMCPPRQVYFREGF